jgi:hypothetical protein
MRVVEGYQAELCHTVLGPNRTVELWFSALKSLPSFGQENSAHLLNYSLDLKSHEDKSKLI